MVGFDGVVGGVGENFFEVLWGDGGKPAFFLPVLDGAFEAAAHEGEVAAEGLDDEGVEAVETGEVPFGHVGGFVDFAAYEDGVDFGAGKKDNPVAEDGCMENGHKVDVGTVGGRGSFSPDADGVELFGHLDVALTPWKKFFEVLKGNNEFSFAGFIGEVFDGVADGKHGAIIEDVGDIGDGGFDGDAGGKFFAVKLKAVELAINSVEVDVEFFVEGLGSLDFFCGFNEH